MRLADWRDSGSTFVYRGHDVFYHRAGTGEPLLLIHGFPTASWDWHKLWGDLERRFDVVAADMLGFGFSDKPRDYPYSLLDQATLQESLCAALGISSVHVLAHDYGDSVTQELLARYEERRARGEQGLEVRSACLLNGGIIPGTHRPLLIQKLLMSPVGGLLAPRLSVRSLRRSLHRIFGPRTRLSEPEVRELWSLIECKGGRRVVHKLIRYMAEREEHRERWVEILRNTTVPVRLVNGLADPISGAHVVEHYRRLVADADVVGLEEIGHYPQLEAPDAVLAGWLPLIRSASARAPRRRRP
jgi:pimeloyl-ACP methyl ester carboxylesterase